MKCKICKKKKRRTMSENDVPTSEVGSAFPTESNITALIEQNRNLMDIIKNLQTPRNPTTSDKLKRVTLPKFNPDGAGADASAWCNTVDLIMADNVVEGSDLVMSLSKALEGSASQWLSQVCFAGITWTQFKELFIGRFVGIETGAAVVLNVFNGRPKTGEGLAKYGTRIVTLLMSKWKTQNFEEIAVSVTLAHMAQLDSKLSRWIFTNNVKTRNELQQRLQAHAFKKRSSDGDANTTFEQKKPKFQSQMKCNFCGKAGHKYANCRARLEQGRNTGKNRNGSSTSEAKERASVKCFKCDEIGHFASACPKGRSGGNGKIYEKRVEICTVAPPSGMINLSGEYVPFCFDSGAECSLVKESIANKFKGKRITNIVKLNGIGNDSICSTQQVLANINIEQYCFEILLHVVMDKFLSSDVLIGHEILGQGFGVSMDAAKFQIYKTKEVNFVNLT